jgi:hypothetical protein
MIVRWLALLALLLPFPAVAQDSLQGSWALDAGGTAIFRFDIARTEDGKWSATWSKPASFASDGNSFSQLKGPAKQVKSMAAIDTPDGIELSFDDPRPGAVPDIFDFKPIDSDAVEMVYVGTDLAPYTLDRVQPGAPIGPWDPNKTYSRADAAEAPNADKVSNIEPASSVGEGQAQAPPTGPKPVGPVPDDFKLKPGAPIGR